MSGKLCGFTHCAILRDYTTQNTIHLFMRLKRILWKTKLTDKHLFMGMFLMQINVIFEPISGLYSIALYCVPGYRYVPLCTRMCYEPLLGC